MTKKELIDLMYFINDDEEVNFFLQDSKEAVGDNLFLFSGEIDTHGNKFLNLMNAKDK